MTQQFVRNRRDKTPRVYVTLKEPAAKRALCLTIYGATAAKVIKHLRESAGRIGISDEQQIAPNAG